jgi:hypothetical protein
VRQFLIKTAGFSIIYLVINQLVLMCGNYYWGNQWYAAKIQYLESQSGKLPNTYFFGSSRVYRQINPNTFDKIYNKGSNFKRKSFNLGAPATFCPETYYLFEKFIKSDIATDVDLVFMELMPVNLISENLMLQERTTYWQNRTDMGFILESVYNNPALSLKEKFKGAKDYTLCYAFNLFDFSHLKQKLFIENENVDYIGPKNNGYYSLDYNLEITKNEKVRKDLLQRKKAIKLDSIFLKERVLEIIRNHNSKNINFDEINLKRILTLINISKEKGIDLIFVLPQIVIDKDLITLSKLIPKRNLIDLSDPKKFPQLYYTHNVFDVGHLNDKGAAIFTELLVNEYIVNNKR